MLYEQSYLGVSQKVYEAYKMKYDSEVIVCNSALDYNLRRLMVSFTAGHLNIKLNSLAEKEKYLFVA